MTLVRDIMTGPVLAVDRTTSSTEAARLMRERGTGDVVVASKGRLAGIVTDRDLAIRLVAEGLDPNATQIGTLCSSDLVGIECTETLESAARVMSEFGVRRLPVYEDEAVLGIISLGDLAQHIDVDQTVKNISTAAPST